MMKRRFRKRPHSNGQHDSKRVINPMKHNYESTGPTGRLRGNAVQLHEKYTSLAREALSNGDRVMMESCLQHAEHYQRQISQYQDNLDSGGGGGNSGGGSGSSGGSDGSWRDSSPPMDSEDSPPTKRGNSKNSGQRNRAPAKNSEDNPNIEVNNEASDESNNEDSQDNMGGLNLPGPINIKLPDSDNEEE